jgi:hypothetical protein
MEITRNIIEENLNNPTILENLYQSDKKTFSEIIKTMHEPESNLIIKYWYTRLFYKPVSANKTADTNDTISGAEKSNTKKYLFTAFLIILSWIPIWLVSSGNAIWRFDVYIWNFKDYLMKAIPVIFSVTLSLFFLFNSTKNYTKIALWIPNIIALIYIILLEYIKGSLPFNHKSQSLDNAFYFMFILLWFFILFAYSNFNIRKLNYSTFLEKFGETMVWSAIFITGGSVVVLLSLGLFHAINIDANDFYEENIVTLGLVASPFVSLLVIDKFNKIKLSVIIANIFLPLILFSLLAFGITSIFTKTKPYEDRDIFIIYNVMMVIVISILVFTSINGIKNKFLNICSYVLPIVTIILDFVTISAVIYRLSEYGISANKITLLGTNIVMLGHLAYMIYLKFKHKIEQNTLYLPLYFLWASIVVFIFPFIFKMA